MGNTKHATTNFRMIYPFIATVNKTDDMHARFESSGYMPLSIEYLGYNDHLGRPVYAMMHFGIQNGDLMRDPDMEFSVDFAHGTIHPRSYRNDYVGVFHEVYMTDSDGSLLYSPKLLTELDQFLWTWLKNIGDQGFDPFRYSC